MTVLFGLRNDRYTTYRTRTPYPPHQDHARPRPFGHRGVVVIVAVVWRRDGRTVCLGSTNFFFYFHFYAYFGMLLKGMGESLILSEDEPLTPNIDPYYYII